MELTGLSMIGQLLMLQPRGKQRALLGVAPAVARAFLEGSDLRDQFI
jgi:hypothetical protein